MSTPLSPSEQVAKSMMLLHGKSPIEALNVMNAVSLANNDIFDNDPDPSDDAINAATEAAIQNLGYATTLEHIGAQYDALRANHAGFWSGNYTLVDSEGDVHTMLINSDTVRVLLEGTDEAASVASEGGGFANRTLRIDNDRIALTLAFSTSADGVDLTGEDVDLDAVTAGFRVSAVGTLSIKGDAAGVRNVEGRRDVSTPAGVFHSAGEEPAWVWAGEYVLRYTDDETWEFHDDTLVIAYDPAAKSLSATLGAAAGTALVYRNSAIFFQLAPTKGAITQVTMEMHATSSGGRKCYLWFETTGQMRTLTGYANRRLDADALWREPGSTGPRPSVAKPASARATLKTARADATTTDDDAGDTIVDFCRTPYDAVFSIKGLIATTKTGTMKGITELATGGSLKVGGVNVTGFRVDETDKDNNHTGRVALYTASGADDRFFPAGAALKAYQQLDPSGDPQAGFAHTVLGVVPDDAKKYELPGLVETDFYEVRMNLLDYADVSANGIEITLATDDTLQKRLIVLEQPAAGDACSYSADLGTGPDKSVADKVGDFTKASVLVRGATGETQNVGQKSYYFALRPKDASGKPGRFVSVNRTIYKPAATAGEYEVDTAASAVEVPVLIRTPIEMDSRDALELSGVSWVPATRDRKYKASIGAIRGQQPFVWRLLQDDQPGGLIWKDGGKKDDPNDKTSILTVGADVSKAGLMSVALTGTIPSGANPGDTYQPVIRIMSDKSCVMKPLLANPQFTIAEPETEQKQTTEIANVAGTVVSAIAALGTILMGVVIYRKDAAKEKKKATSDKSIKLNEMSVDALEKVAGDFTKLSDATRNIAKDKTRIRDITKALQSLEAVIPKIDTKIGELNEAIKNAGSAEEIATLREELETLRDEMKKREKQINDKQKDKDVSDESNSIST